MNRIAGLLAAWGLVFFAMGPATALQLPVMSISPTTGSAGTEIVVTFSQYSPGIVIEVYEDSASGALLATGLANESGTGVIPVSIPASTPTGSYLIYVCGLCTSQFPEWAARSFQVTQSPGATSTTTTTNVPATTTTLAATTTTAPAATTTVAATTTTAPAATTTVAATTTIVAATPTTPAGGGSSSQGILIGLLFASLMVGSFLGGALVRSRGQLRKQAPPPPPAP